MDTVVLRGWPLLLAAVAAWPTYRFLFEGTEPGFITSAVAAGFCGAFGTFLAALFWIVPLAVGRYAVQRHVSSHYPQMLVVDRLLHLMSHLEEKEPLREPVHKRVITNYLEEVAVSFETDIPAYLRSGDSATNTWLKQTCCCIAATLRDFKKWVLLPREDTTELLQRRIAAMLIHAALGQWDHIERMEAQATRSRLQALLGFARVLIVALLPFGLLWLTHATLGFAGASREYAIGGAVLWALLTLLVSFDPLFGAKVAAMREAAQSLPIIGSRREPM